MPTNDTYRCQISQALPRLLALFDRDRTSKSFGVGDRYFWAWGLIDFSNGSFQGAANGMARLWSCGMWPYPAESDAFIARLDSIFKGARFAMRRDGSCEEAFPYEGSYCVTALVAFDLLAAIDTMETAGLPESTIEDWMLTVAPMVEYLKKHDESHALISNHLATAVAALNRWHKRTGDQEAETKARLLLDRILEHQSEEGWFEEYGGADPGYETLCLHYLADVHQLRPDWGLLEPLARSVRFLWHFAHPDGSFGGLYGSRCTRFYYPSGVLAMAEDIPEARALAHYMARSIADNKVVSLSSMDEPNLIPIFNSYCWAAEIASVNSLTAGALQLPCMQTEKMRIRFPEAGLLIDRGPRHYTVISTLKGGAVSHFSADSKAVHNAGIVVRNRNGVLGSTLVADASNAVDIENNELTVHSTVRSMVKRLPNVFYFLGLRSLSVTLLRSTRIREWVKRLLARWLITGGKRWPATNRRTITFGRDLTILDDPSLPEGYLEVENVKVFVPIHMASQGYWQVQDEEISP